jgi:hypothetical protein
MNPPCCCQAVVRVPVVWVLQALPLIHRQLLCPLVCRRLLLIQALVEPCPLLVLLPHLPLFLALLELHLVPWAPLEQPWAAPLTRQCLPLEVFHKLGHSWAKQRHWACQEQPLQVP